MVRHVEKAIDEFRRTHAHAERRSG
jgi:hypothetical protein